jgi:hypothetical protein
MQREPTGEKHIAPLGTIWNEIVPGLAALPLEELYDGNKVSEEDPHLHFFPVGCDYVCY